MMTKLNENIDNKTTIKLLFGMSWALLYVIIRIIVFQASGMFDVSGFTPYQLQLFLNLISIACAIEAPGVLIIIYQLYEKRRKHNECV